jgi:hypothetical protein
VVEVGAGLGGTTRVLCSGDEKEWLCVEPDLELGERLRASIALGELPSCCEVLTGTLAGIDRAEQFDTVLYIDVLEHIADDRAELRQAAECTVPGGHVIVLAPAHQWLYTPFDRSIGHFRRYNKRTLAALAPPALELVSLRYLDSIGLSASLANRVLLKSSMPTARQIAIWNKIMVPLSRACDPLLGYSVGKSVLGIWTKGNV